LIEYRCGKLYVCRSWIGNIDIGRS
jgi:hypothetical protein